MQIISDKEEYGAGKDAVKLKLADAIGTLEDAIAYAAEKAKVTNFKVEEYPKPKDPFEQLRDVLNNIDEGVEEKVMKAQLGRYYKDVYFLKQSLKNQQVSYFTLLPYKIEMY